MIQFTKATRTKAKLRMGIMGAAGSGKTMGALKVAKGILGGDMSKVFVIDTEHGSADLYSNMGEYNTYTLQAPFGPLRYVEAVKAAEQAGAKVIIIDSLSHAWEGEGGELDQVNKKGGNSFTAWKDVTPQHRQLVESLLQSDCHLICTLRSKQEYVLEEQQNKQGRMVQVPVRKGMAPIMRSGFEYEMTIFVEVREDHFAQATKDRTELLDGKIIQLSEQMGVELKQWLDSGGEPKSQAPVSEPIHETKAPVPESGPVERLEEVGSGLTESFIVVQSLKREIETLTNKGEARTLWEKIVDKTNAIGNPAANDLKEKLKAKAASLGE